MAMLLDGKWVDGPAHVGGCVRDYYDQIRADKCVASCPVNKMLFEQMERREGKEAAEKYWRDNGWNVPRESSLADAINRIRFETLGKIEEHTRALFLKLCELETEVRSKGL